MTIAISYSIDQGKVTLISLAKVQTNSQTAKQFGKYLSLAI
jgi:hypothetical protein